MSDLDWTALQSNLVACIGSMLIADDLADFIRFRAVCHPWRSSTEETKRRADCLHPHNWIMLYTKWPAVEPIQFYNTSTHKSFWVNLAVNLNQYSLYSCFTCLVMLKNKSTQGFALFNPFMRSITQLPSKILSNCPKAPSKLEDIIYVSGKNQISDVHVTSSSTIVLRISTLDYLVWTKPGDESWMYAKCNVLSCTDVLFNEDRIFAIDVNRGIVQINFSNEMSSQPQVEVIIPGLPENALHLIDCSGNIFMVSLRLRNADGSWQIDEIYKLDLKKKTYIHVRNIGSHSFFLSYNRAFSISHKKGLIPANSIYFCHEYNCEISFHNLSTNCLKFSSKKPFLRPNSLVKKLINYCVQTNIYKLHQEDDSSLLHYED